MGMTYLDLKPYFNLKMVYPDNTTFVPGECIGIHNLIVEERNYLFGETKKDGRQALFEKNDKGDHLINCAAQKIRAEEMLRQGACFQDLIHGEFFRIES